MGSSSAALTQTAVAAKPMVQRACACGGKKPGGCEECRKRRLQRKADPRNAGSAPVIGTDFHGGGARLPAEARRTLEPRFGVSFDAVRVHDDPRSHRLARDLGARAFTVGQDVHFAAGEFRPGSHDGLRLLAHELTHTVQQRSVSAGASGEWLEIDEAVSTLERAADTTADAVLAGGGGTGLPAVVAGGALIQRKEAAEGTRTRTVDENTTVTVTRSLIERPCTRVSESLTTPRSDIFRWDEQAGAIRLVYSICNGKIQLEGGATLDYSDVQRAAKDLLRSVGSNPAGAPSAVEDAINGATISASGHVSFTVSRTLDVTVSGDSTAGTQQQTAKAKVRVLVNTANNKVQVIAEAGAGITQSAITKEVEKFLKGQLNLGPVSIEVKLVDKATTPSGGPTSSQRDISVRGGVDVGGGLDLGCEWRRTEDPSRQGSKEDKFTCGPQVTFDRPKPPKEVTCYACDCPPPRPDYTCRKVVKAHEEKVVDVPAGKQLERMLYEYDKSNPLNPDEFKGQVGSIAGLIKGGYEVQFIRGYASPEASRIYNKDLGERRARHAHKEIDARLKKDQITGTLPAPEGIGELLGESSTREGEARNKELIDELRSKLQPLNDEGRLDLLLGVDNPRRKDPAQRKQVLADIQQFIDGTDAEGKALKERARWEKIFPHLRRVEVLLKREEKSHPEERGGSDKPSACDAADKAFIDGELGPIPEGKRLPQEMCS